MSAKMLLQVWKIICMYLQRKVSFIPVASRSFKAPVLQPDGSLCRFSCRHASLFFLLMTLYVVSQLGTVISYLKLFSLIQFTKKENSCLHFGLLPVFTQVMVVIQNKQRSKMVGTT